MSALRVNSGTANKNPPDEMRSLQFSKSIEQAMTLVGEHEALIPYFQEADFN
jgi:hypothetical protein